MEYISGYNKEGMGQSTSAIDHEKVNAYHAARGLLDSMGYMVLPEEQYQLMLKELDFLTASRDAWKVIAELLSEKWFVDNMVTSYVHCIHCGDYAKSEDGITHSPDCPIEQLRKMKEGEG